MVGLARRAVVIGSLGVLACGMRASAQFSSEPAGPQSARLIKAAATQVGVTTIYDPAYVRLAFPGGDVPRERGVCTDVVVRAYRDAFGIDLQALVNVDMRAHFASYPRRWGLSRPDPNIDHRRVENLRVFFARQKAALAVPASSKEWQPGDIATQELVPPGTVKAGLPHIGIVSDARAPSGTPTVIHNIGAGTRVEDILDTYRITGRYRWSPRV